MSKVIISAKILPQCLGNLPAFLIDAPGQFQRNVLGGIPRPSLARIEGRDPDRLAVLTGEHVADVA
jgi:hypothetical protein